MGYQTALRASNAPVTVTSSRVVRVWGSAWKGAPVAGQGTLTVHDGEFGLAVVHLGDAVVEAGAGDAAEAAAADARECVGACADVGGRVGKAEADLGGLQPQLECYVESL